MSAQVEDQVERSWRVNAATWSFSKRNSSELRRQEERREAIHSLALLSVGGSVGDHLGNWRIIRR